MFTRLWSSVIEFLSDAKSEVRKVSFPSWSETLGSTTVVIIFCVIMSLYLSLIDTVLVWLISKVI
jgi:preprotein translocase subunit SecE